MSSTIYPQSWNEMFCFVSGAGFSENGFVSNAGFSENDFQSVNNKRMTRFRPFVD